MEIIVNLNLFCLCSIQTLTFLLNDSILSSLLKFGQIFDTDLKESFVFLLCVDVSGFGQPLYLTYTQWTTALLSRTKPFPRVNTESNQSGIVHQLLFDLRHCTFQQAEVCWFNMTQYTNVNSSWLRVTTTLAHDSLHIHVSQRVNHSALLVSWAMADNRRVIEIRDWARGLGQVVNSTQMCPWCEAESECFAM